MMTTIHSGRGKVCAVPRQPILDCRTRQRVAGWLRYKMDTLGLTPTQAAKTLDVDLAGLSRVLRFGGPIGLNLVVAIHRKLHLDANQLLDFDPPEKYLRPPEE